MACAAAGRDPTSKRTTFTNARLRLNQLQSRFPNHNLNLRQLPLAKSNTAVSTAILVGIMEREMDLLGTATITANNVETSPLS